MNWNIKYFNGRSTVEVMLYRSSLAAYLVKLTSTLILLFMSISSLAGQSAASPTSTNWQLTEPKTIGLIEVLVPFQGFKTPVDGYLKVQHLMRNDLIHQSQTRLSVVCSIYYLNPIVGGSPYGKAAQISSCKKDKVPKAQQVIYSQIFKEFGEKIHIEKLKQFALLN